MKVFEVERMQSMADYLKNNLQCITTTVKPVFIYGSGWDPDSMGQ
jgi:hypothetical protein